MLKPWMLSDIASALSARLLGADVAFSAVGTDSRSIAAGQLFVALAGPRFDGHDYLAEVAAKGAVAALVEREVANALLPQLLVADTRLALGQLGALNRQAFTGPLAAVTGSSGKTSVKEMLASILRAALNGAVLATRDGPVEVHAARGVLLACGGFPHDTERKRALLPHAPNGTEHHSYTPGGCLLAVHIVGAETPTE